MVQIRRKKYLITFYAEKFIHFVVKISEPLTIHVWSKRPRKKLNSAQTVKSSELDESVMQLIKPTGFYTKIRALLFLGSGILSF